MRVSERERKTSPSLEPLRRYHDRPEQRGDIHHQHRAPHLPAGGALKQDSPRRAGRHQHHRRHRPDPERPQDVLPVSVVVIDARDVDVERTLCKVADSVLVVVAGQGLDQPEHGIGPERHAAHHAEDEHHLRPFGVGQSRRPDGQRSGGSAEKVSALRMRSSVSSRVKRCSSSTRRPCRSSATVTFSCSASGTNSEMSGTLSPVSLN